MFKRNSNSGLWDLSDQVTGKGVFPKLTEELLTIVADHRTLKNLNLKPRKLIAVYKVDAIGGIHTPAIYNLTVDKSSLNMYENFNFNFNLFSLKLTPWGY